MLDVAAQRADARPDVNGPPPSGLVGGAANGHTSDANEFKSSFFKGPHFVGLFKTPQNCLKHLQNSLASRICGNTESHSNLRLEIPRPARAPHAGGRAPILVCHSYFC